MPLAESICAKVPTFLSAFLLLLQMNAAVSQYLEALDSNFMVIDV
jgi:hypothetical protein